MAPVSDTSAAISGPPSSTPMATSSVSNPPKRSITGASTADTRVNIASIRASAPGVSSVPTTNCRMAWKALVIAAPICCAHWSRRPSDLTCSTQPRMSLNCCFRNSKGPLSAIRRAKFDQASPRLESMPSQLSARRSMPPPAMPRHARAVAATMAARLFLSIVARICFPASSQVITILLPSVRACRPKRSIGSISPRPAAAMAVIASFRLVPNTEAASPAAFRAKSAASPRMPKVCSETPARTTSATLKGVFCANSVSSFKRFWAASALPITVSSVSRYRSKSAAPRTNC